MDRRLLSDRFPRSSTYSPDWLTAAVSGGANPLWPTEWLTAAMALEPGMRVLDLGCGRAASSVFLRRELGVEVWATDLWFSPSFVYYGTDDLYLGDIARLLRPGGVIGIAGAGLEHEIDGEVPERLRAWWEPAMWCLHSAGWWRLHWERTGIVEVETADAMEDGWERWLEWQRFASPGNATEIAALEADRGRTLGYVRAVARRTAAPIDPPITSIATEYAAVPLLREPTQRE